MSWYYGFPKAMTVAEHKEKIAKKIASLKKKHSDLQPVIIAKRAITHTPWGNSWCKNIESYKDYEYRLDRGRSYVRRGAIVDLKISPGTIKALVYGTKLYTVTITVASTTKSLWRSIIKECSGKINSLIELLQGTFSEHVMNIISQPDRGLFPKPHEITLNCSCPDYASLCKHVSATLYAIGAVIDTNPLQLFVLRQVDHTELLPKSMNNITLNMQPIDSSTIVNDDLSELFDITMTKDTSSKKRKKKIKREQKMQ